MWEPGKPFCVLLLASLIACSACYQIDLRDNGPIAKGGTITFTAVLYDEGTVVAGPLLKFTWNDNAIPGHFAEMDSKDGTSTWSVTYNASVYPQGPYIAQVTVCKYMLSLFCYDMTSNRIWFEITDTLNGQITLLQNNNTLVRTSYVSSVGAVTHNVTLKPTDADYVRKATSVISYWFVDCTYYGARSGLEFDFNYTQPDQAHSVETLVVADFTPIPITTTTTTTTTTATTTTPKTTTTTSKPSTTKPTPTTTTTFKPTTTSTKPTPTIPTTTPQPTATKKAAVVRRDAPFPPTPAPPPAQNITQLVDGRLVPYNGTFPFICNGTMVAADPRKSYGFFVKKLQVKAPITKVNVTGNNWLQHGKMLRLDVRCQASKNLKYCTRFERGAYNVTANETCAIYHQLDTCEFLIERYLGESMEHTVVIIVENEVSKVVTPVTVTVYKVKKQAQLSVIVVPVACCLVAIVCIIFGVAYYIQNRSRFVVEVADFNFGQDYSALEYKTFKERLRESISGAFLTRANSPDSSEPPVWPPGGRKYGSMTS